MSTAGARPQAGVVDLSSGRTIAQQLEAAGITVSGPLGAGATGTVHAASIGDATGFVLKTGHADSPGAQAALRNEARALHRLEPIANGVPRLVRELTASDTVALLLAPQGTSTIAEWQPSDPDAAMSRKIAIISALVQTLVAVHELGVVHGDLAPANVVLCAERPMLIDFGAATIDGDAPEGLRGTLPYTAPEIITGAPCRPDTDLYGLAQVAVELLTDAPTLALAGAERRAALLARGVSGPLTEVLLAAIGPDPAERPDHATWLAALAGDPIETTADRPPSLSPTAPRAAGGVVTREFGPRPPAVATAPTRGDRRRLVPLLAGSASLLVGAVMVIVVARIAARGPDELQAHAHGRLAAATASTTAAPAPNQPATPDQPAAPTSPTAPAPAPTPGSGSGSGSGSAIVPSIDWDPVRAEATVAHDGAVRRYHIGAPGDQLVVGRWRCTGDPRPVLYRPSTGDLYEFTGWATDRPSAANPADRGGTVGGTLRRGLDGPCEVPVIDPPVAPTHP